MRLLSDTGFFAIVSSMPQDFVHLHVHSDYSLLDGASSIKELITTAKNLGQKSLALTDHGNMFAALRFFRECKAQGIKPVIGCEVYVANGSRFSKPENTNTGVRKYFHGAVLQRLHRRDVLQASY